MKKILTFSLILAVLQSILFWQKEFGISVVIFVIAAILMLVLVLEEQKKIKKRGGLILLIPIILLASTYFIFNNVFFNILNILAIIGLVLIMIIWVTDEKERFKFLIHKMFALIFGGFEFLDEIAKSLKIKKKEDRNRKNNIIKIIKAILISLPIVIIVLFLLSSADKIFESIFGNVIQDIFKYVFSENIFMLIMRIGLIVMLFFYFAGFALNIYREKSMYTAIDETRREGEVKLNRFNINVTLTILNILYLLFAGIQFVYLFTKAGIGEDFDYAEYARQGFFQLMFVTFINFIMIFISHINKGKEETGEDVVRIKSDDKSKQYAKIMNILMCLFTVVIIASSFFRMNLYEQEYGYTYLRLFVYFILGTELLLIIPTIIYLLYGKIKLFKSYIIIIAGMYVALNFINIDYVIAKRNIDRYYSTKVEERKIDMTYLMYNTGIDAISQIERLVYSDSDEIKLEAYACLYNRKASLNMEENLSWQEFNLSKLNSKKEINKIDETIGKIDEMYELYLQQKKEEEDRYYQELYNNNYNSNYYNDYYNNSNNYNYDYEYYDYNYENDYQQFFNYQDEAKSLMDIMD